MWQISCVLKEITVIFSKNETKKWFVEENLAMTEGEGSPKDIYILPQARNN